jgi:hypothetical protein
MTMDSGSTFEHEMRLVLISVAFVTLAACTEKPTKSPPARDLPDSGRIASDAASQQPTVRSDGRLGSEVPSPECINLGYRAGKAFAEAWGSDGYKCVKDSDCVEVWSAPDCSRWCGGAVNSASADAVARAVASIDGAICGEFFAKLCALGPAAAGLEAVAVSTEAKLARPGVALILNLRTTSLRIKSLALPGYLISKSSRLRKNSAVTCTPVSVT